MNNDRIQEIKRGIEQVEDYELESDVFDVITLKTNAKIIAEVFDSDFTPVFTNAIKNLSYLLSEVERLQKENKVMKEALEWTRKRFEEEWTYEPGIGEVVDEIIVRFTQ